MAKRQTAKLDLEEVLQQFDRELDSQIDAQTAAQIRAVIANASAEYIVAPPAKRLAIIEQCVRLMLVEKNPNLKFVHLGTLETVRVRALRDFGKRKEPEMAAMLSVLERDARTYTAADAAVITKALKRLD
jgi:hypothetical protein